MRIVMLTDDGKSVDRRILLEAESLIDEGHEVIVVARQDGKAPAGDRLGRVKVMWIDLDLGYLEGAFDDLGFDLAGQEGSAGLSGPRFAKLRALMVKLGIARMTNELDLEQERRGAELKSGLHRFRSKFRLRLKEFKLRYIKQFWAGTAEKLAQAPTLDPELLADLPEVNLWERALFYRTLYLDPDVIHVHDLPQLLAGVYAKRVLGVPLIYDAHEVYPQISTLTDAETRFLHSKEQLLLKYCDATITVNPYCSRLMEYCYDCKPFDIIMNATGGDALAGSRGGFKGRLRRKLRLGQGAKILMYQGWIADVGRGLTELVSAFAAVRPEVHLVMMGYGDVDKFHRLAREAGVARRVHILPPVPWDELVSWSSEADAGIIPYQPVDFNHRVCSPNKLFEFIAARLPIICNDLPFLRQVVEGEGFGLVHSMSNAAEIAQAINRAFDPQDQVLQKAREALERRGSAWEWPVEAAKLKEIYARLPLPERYRGLSEPPKAMIDLDQLLA